jgi:hypothetical protein
MAAEAAALAEKSKIETDSEGEVDDFWVEFDWSKDAIFAALARAWPFFKEDDLTAISLWYIDQLNACRVVVDDYASSKSNIMKVMLEKTLSTMDGMNELIADTWEEYLSKPCFLDNKWHPAIISAMDHWQLQIPSASLTRFHENSALHNCIWRDFEVVKKTMDRKFQGGERYTWNQFATKLLCLCKKQDGNQAHDKNKFKNKAELLASVEGQFIRDPA